MTDFELTRLAFKAAFSGADITEDKDMMRHWSPLTDDGDALRLAVKLGFGFDVLLTLGATELSYGNGDDTLLEYHNKDPYAATRRAIVRAAAAIGKEMK